MKARISAWFEPYGNTNRMGSVIPGSNVHQKAAFKSGVYLIKDKNSKRIVYIGISKSNLYKTLYRHFQAWNSKQERLVFEKKGFLIRIIFCPPNKVQRLERYLVGLFNPVYNTNSTTWTAADESISQAMLAKAGFIPRYDIPF